MIEFKVNSIHTLKVKINLALNNEKDEEDQVILFWLTDSEGNKYDVLQDPVLEIGNDKFRTMRHITKDAQDFSFTMKMPDKPGDYTLQTNVTLFGSDPGRSIRLVE